MAVDRANCDCQHEIGTKEAPGAAAARIVGYLRLAEISVGQVWQP
jgi:hypothetical protein